MGQVGTAGLEAGAQHLPPQLALGVDADVAALDDGAWYSSDSAQQTFSGSQAGTVMAMVPPGRSTRVSSSSAARSSGTCSITSEAMIRSKAPSVNGRLVPSPCTEVHDRPGAISPASFMAEAVSTDLLELG